MASNKHFFYGAEACLIDEAADRVHARHEGAERCLFEGDVELEVVLQAAQSPNLFVPKTVICIKNPHFLSKAVEKDEAAKWAAFFAGDLDPSVAVLVVNYGSVDMRKKCASSLKKTFQTQQFESFKDWEDDKRIAWTRQRFSGFKKKIDDEALTVFCQMIGNNIGATITEMATLLVYVGERENVSLDDIKACCSAEHASVYAFMESMKKRDYKACYAAVRGLQENGEVPVKLMGLVASSLRLYTQLILMKKEPPAAIAKALGKHPFFIQQLLREIGKKFEFDDLKRMTMQLAELDYDVKTGKVPMDHVFRVLPGLLCLKT